MIYVQLYKTYAFHEFIILFENTIIMDHLSVRISLRILQMIPRTFKKHLENKSKNMKFLLKLLIVLKLTLTSKPLGLTSLSSSPSLNVLVEGGNLKASEEIVNLNSFPLLERNSTTPL